MSFEVFERKVVGVASVLGPVVTIHHDGSMTLNTDALQLFQPFLQELETQELRLLLMYDRATEQIGFRPVPVTEKNGYIVRQLPRAKWHKINSTTFLRHFGVMTARVRNFRPRLGQTEVFFSLKEDEIKPN